jgi:hypothetical protein
MYERQAFFKDGTLWYMTVISALGRLRREGSRVEASLN